MKSGNLIESPSKSKKRVLFVTQSLELGGTEKQIVTLVNSLDMLKVPCDIFSFQNDGALRAEIRQPGVRIFTGGLASGEISRFSWKIIPAQCRLLKCIRQVKPTVLHAYLPMTTFLGAVAGKLASVPLIITSKRALGKHQDRHPLLAPLDRWANALSDTVTVNSKAVWTDVINRDRIKPEKLCLIYNGIDFARFSKAESLDLEPLKRSLKIGPGDKTIINIANLIPYKGQFDLLKAAQIVIHNRPDTKFLLVGEDRGILNQLIHMARSLGIENNVLFLGQRQDIPELLAISEISVVTSYEEGFSNAILEAMAAGLPIIATDVGGNSEAIRHGQTGLLIPPQDPELLAKSILTLIDNPGMANQYGNSGRHRAHDLFSRDIMVRQHINLYKFPDNLVV